MSRSIRLAIIGAGSAQFSLDIVRDLCATPSLSGSDVVFMDVSDARLDMIHTLAVRYAQETESDLRFHRTTDRAAALDGADVVINTALAGGHTREEAERAVLEGQGFYRGMHPSEGFFHQYDLMLSVAQDIMAICPDAWLVQSSNPVFDGCTLMTRETGVKAVGLCHGPFGGMRKVADVLGLDPERVTFETPGVNHCVWLTTFLYDGEDAYPLLDRWIEEESERYWADYGNRFNQTQLSRGAIDMYRLYGYLPIGDTSRAIWPEAWWYNVSLEEKQRWWGPVGGFDSELGWAEYLEQVGESVAMMTRVAEDRSQRVTDLLPPQKSDEQIVPIIDALINDVRGHFIVNVPNNGAIAGIADDVVVEVPAVVDGRGIRPEIVGALPASIMLGAVAPQILLMERRLEGFLRRDRRFLIQVLMSEHRTQSREHAEATLDAILAMPGNEAMAGHYGAPVPVRA